KSHDERRANIAPETRRREEIPAGLWFLPGTALAQVGKYMFPRKEKIRMTPRYKKALFAVLPFAGSLCVAPLASADRYSDYGSQGYSEYGSRSGRNESQMSQQDLRSFQDYLDSHQETA